MDTTKTVSLAEEPRTIRLRPAERAFAWMLRNLRYGSLQIHFPSGGSVVVGDLSGPCVQLRILKNCFFKKVISGGSVAFGEAYVDGDWTTGDLSAVLFLLARNQSQLGKIQMGFSFVARKMNRLYHRARRNTLEKSKENIQEHYDLSNDFYQTFLDSTMTYSSALFDFEAQSLEAGQLKKIDRMLDLAGIKPGDALLEIGSGWGALALRAAQRGCRVKTITLSNEQYAFSKALFESKGVSHLIDIQLEDYRLQEGQYDAVVSCEMIEAVGKEFLESYFTVVKASLKPKKRAVIQAITIPDARYDAYSDSCDWIQKHIFPGGHLPSPNSIRHHVESRGDARILKTNSFGRDYAETLRRWASSFNDHSAAVGALGFDEKFFRKWNYYLSYCEAGFDADLIDVRHVVIEKL